MSGIRKFKFSPLIIGFILALFCYQTSYADDTSLGRTPEGVFPLEETDVVMESEEIVVDLEKNSVECTFVFHNTGKSKNVLMGFPGKLFDSLDSGLTQEVNLEIKNFKSYVNGNELSVAHEKVDENYNTQPSNGLKYSEYFTFTVPFKEGEKLTVKNYYDFTPSFDSMANVFSGYVLKTGAMWKGNIGSAKVTFKLGKLQPYEIESLKPGGFKFVGGELVWERMDFEPSYDLWLYFNTFRYSQIDQFISNYGNSKDEIVNEIETYKRVVELADKGDTTELLGMYSKAVEQKDSVLALYIESFLPEDKKTPEKPALGDIKIEDRNGDYLISCDIQSIDAPTVQIRVSHMEKDKEILDWELESSSCSFSLAPGIEYNITYTLRDWMDREETKTIKYKVPVKGEVSVGSQTQPSVNATPSVTATPSATINPNIEPEISNETRVVLVTNAKSLPKRTSVWVLSAIFILISVALVIWYNRKKVH